MPRGPFQGTYQSGVRPTIVTAPDAMVLINGETDLLGCPSCRRKFDWNKYITSIQVDLSVDSVPGSASINLSIPRHTIDDFYFEGTPIITSMMEIEIYAKGYYLVGGVPQYYPIFWGLVTEVGDNYSSGEHSVTIHCADILKWWEICKMNVNAAWTVPTGQLGRNIFGNVFFGTNPYDVIYSLAQNSTGDVVIGAGSLNSINKDKGGQGKTFSSFTEDMMRYWQIRFGNIRSNLLLYGFNGVAVRGDSLYEAQRAAGNRPARNFASKMVAQADGSPSSTATSHHFTPSDNSVVAIKTPFGQAAQINFWQSEYQTKLEVANAAKEAIGFEFYMDVTGDIVFKPPFYNLDVIGNKPVSWIQDIDIIDWDFSESEAEVVTQLTMQGSYGQGNVDYGLDSSTDAMASVTDFHLLRKYGWRSHTYNSEFMGDKNMLYYHGLDVLDRINSKRNRGTVTIPLRPELRLGFPVYIASKDQIWYVNGISHNVQFGGRATTTLTLTAKRTKFIAPTGICPLVLTSCTVTPIKNQAPPTVVASQPQAQPPPPNPDAVFTYTAQQLSAGGKFALTLTNPAFLPAQPTAPPTGSGTTSNPYDPIIMRHPKTGRVVGYPNAVMVYTGPYTNVSAAQQNQTAGQNPTNTNQALPQAAQPVISTLQSQNTTAQDTALQSGAVDSLSSTYLNKTYQYGLSSEGIYVYAYDQGGPGTNGNAAISEAFLMPSANLTPKTAAGTIAPPLKNGSTFIRPVSDARGFEVIGHYRYGRGVSLSDGNLVYNNSTNQTTAASVNLQVALSGNLFATLQAQSAGLTSITSSAPNPITSLSTLEPEDLQTAGVPSNTGASGSTPGATSDSLTPITFVNAPTLGSQAQQGLSPTAEASQLSMALTLSEMAVVDSAGSLSNSSGVFSGNTANCPCLMGRSDLAFISQGYQVTSNPLLNTSSPDNSTLPNPNNFSVVGGQALSEGFPAVQPNMVNPPGGVGPPTIIDTFLYSLYSALDGPHQSYEAQIIGDQISATAPQATFPPSQPPDNPSLSSIVQQIKLAENSISQGFNTAAASFSQATNTADSAFTSTWKSFAASLQNASLTTLLVGQVASGQSQLMTLQTQLATLTALKSNSTSLPGDIAGQIADIQNQITSTSLDLSAKQLQLAQLQTPSGETSTT